MEERTDVRRGAHSRTDLPLQVDFKAVCRHSLYEGHIFFLDFVWALESPGTQKFPLPLPPLSTSPIVQTCCQQASVSIWFCEMCSGLCAEIGLFGDRPGQLCLRRDSAIAESEETDRDGESGVSHVREGSLEAVS